jgi:short-subunit dehydrogenase involved in D-alanine esterification of teichoic acids
MFLNLNPEKWGKYFWIGLNFIAYAYPKSPSKEEQENVKNYIISLGKVIPCDKCRNNFIKHLNKLPLDNHALSSRDNLINWLVAFHNEVNIMLNKRTISTEEYYKIMQKLLEDNNNNLLKNKKLLSLIILALIAIILVIYVKYK